MVEHITNEKGEILARVWENPGFQEIYDYKGVEKYRRRLKRKQEQIFNQFDASKHLFQKVYYHPGLLHDDEIKLRQIWFDSNASHETTRKIIRNTFFVGYWPLTYAVSRNVRPWGVFFYTVAYYGVYHYTQKWALGGLQRGLNSNVEDFAKKYGVKKPDEYVQENK